MNFFTIFMTGIGLSMDACALTVANCTTYKNCLSKKQEWAIPVMFALFQGLMPLIGFFVGSFFAEFLSSIKGYLVAGVFYALCGKIVYDIIKERGEKEVCPVKSKFTFSFLCMQALATSIDALIIGVTMSLGLTFSVWLAALTITAVTFILVTLALVVGKAFGKILGNYAEWVGAVILFALATYNLISCFI